MVNLVPSSGCHDNDGPDGLGKACQHVHVACLGMFQQYLLECAPQTTAASIGGPPVWKTDDRIGAPGLSPGDPQRAHRFHWCDRAGSWEACLHRWFPLSEFTSILTIHYITILREIVPDQ